MFVMRLIVLHPHRKLHTWNLITSCSICPRVTTKVKLQNSLAFSHLSLSFSTPHTHYCLFNDLLNVNCLQTFINLILLFPLCLGLRRKTRQSSSKSTENQHNHHQQHPLQQQHHQKPKTINLLNERSSKLLSNSKTTTTTTTTKLAISLDSFTNLLNNSNTDDDVLMITKQIYNNAMQHQQLQHHNHNHNHNHTSHNVSTSSPSSLGGRDVEPQPHLNATTSHLRRFELEI